MDPLTQRVARVALPLFAALSATPAMGQPLERVEITGSSIKRVQLEGPAPVETYRRQDIERTGASNLNELLKSISTVDIFDSGELSSNTPTGAGTSQARMRGLLESNVLVLLNGRRLAINGLHDSTGSGAAVDLNMIPISAIERIEILKDGASAIYGADAVAGVINFITRKSYTGVEMRAGYGTPQQPGGEETSAGLTFGFGDLGATGYNVFAGIDMFKRKPILRKDREISKTSDFRAQGGPDARSFFAPTGTFIDADFLPTGVTVRPCPAGSFNDNACRFDYNALDLLTAYNGADRISGLLIGTLALPQDLRLTSELLLSRANDRFDTLPIPDIFTAPSGALYFGRFMQGGPRTTDRQSDLYQASAGIEGDAAGLDWKVEAGQGGSKVVNDDRNYFDSAGFTAATRSGAIDPTVTTNSQALVDSLKVTPRREGRSTVTFLNAKVSGEFGQLPGGPFGFAVGSSVWRDKVTDRPDALSQAGAVVGSVKQAAVDASRSVYAVFGELSLPLAAALETQLALRYDHYPTYSRSSPKLAARYILDPALSVRGSYSRSFRAPSLKQSFGGSEEGSATFTSDPLCAALGQPLGCSIAGFQLFGSNPNLKPERGETINLGAVVEPVPEFSIALDWWRVNVEDSIDIPTVDQAVRLGQFGRGAGRIVVSTDLRNFARISNQGVDFDLRWSLPKADVGQFTVRNTATYYRHQRKLIDTATGWEDFNATYNRPRWRNTFTLGFGSGAWQTQVAVRNTSGFYDTVNAVVDASNERRVEGFSEIDVVGSYSGFKSVKIDFGIKNLLDEAPPFSATNAGDNLYTQLGFAELYSARGRFFYASLSYAF